MKHLSAIVIGIILPISVIAQTDTLSQKKPFELAPVEITEKRLGTSGDAVSGRNVVVITSEMIRQMPVTTLNEVLQNVSGADLRQRGPMGAQADLSILGSTFEQVLILINGIPMRDPQTGHNQLNLPVDLSQVDRIEILTGSASRIYGANAMAGAINIITKDPGSDLLYVQAFAGSNFENDTASGKQYYLSGGRAAIGFKGKNAGHQLDVSFIETNGYQHNSASSQQRINYLGRIKTGSGKLDLFGGTVFNKFDANSYYAAPYDVNSTEAVNTVYGGIKYEKKIGAWEIKPLGYVRYNHDDYVFIKENPAYYRNNHYTTAGGVEVHAKNDNRFGTSGLGVEARTEMINSNNLGKHQRDYYSIYAEHRFSIGQRAQITAGANAQYNTDFGWKFYPGAEMNVKLRKELALYGNAGLSNRLPSYTDLYYSGPANIGNAALKPERALNAEGGLKWNDAHLIAQAGAFIRESHNFIDFTRASDTLSWQPQNFAHVRMTGVDGRVQYQITPTENFFAVQALFLGYTWLQQEISNNGEFSKYAMEHLTQQVTGRLTLKTSKYFSHTISTRYLERFSGAQYAVFDYRLRFTAGKISAFADVTNLADRSYVESGVIRMPGRWFRIGLEFKLPNRRGL